MKDLTQDDVRKVALDLVECVDKYDTEDSAAGFNIAYISGVCAMSKAVIREIARREAEAQRELEEWRKKHELEV